ncbi:MAG TPA: helix-turn-helix transcriptional regulator, partial [Marinobacter adhaerens]|nr:helix-turn-helix transcriptional regulator [Marinobacter adhaerens]
MGQCVKPFNDGCAANDEFQSANSGLQRGELIRDLLRQRVHIPPVPSDSMVRPKLDTRIAEALTSRGVLFLEAPCGYGKSHAVVSGLVSAQMAADQVRWITLNSQDNAPSRFLTLLAIALDLPETPEQGLQSGATFSDTLSMMQVALAREGSGQPRVLVLDNLQNLSNPAVVDLLQQLVMEFPSGSSIVLISRKALPFETHSLELENRFTRIGSETLEFSRSETFEFFRSATTKSELTSVAVDNLYYMTEGWATPLALYRREVAQNIERKPIQETPSVERFLKESVLGNLTPGQMRSMRGIAELELCSDELFLALERLLPEAGFVPSQAAERGLPLKPMPGRGRWFRVNPLLQEWLKSPVMAGYSERMLQASRWFGVRDQFPEALKYALLSGDAEEVIR